MWKPIRFSYELPMYGKLELHFDARSSSGTECFIIDDVVLAREK